MLKHAQISKIVGVMLFCLLLSFVIPTVYATTDLNGVGGSKTTETTTVIESTTPVTQEPVVEQNTTNNKGSVDAIKGGLPDSKQNVQDVEDTANAIGNMFNEAGPDSEAVEAANQFIAPFARILNKVMAVILGITSLLMMFITVLDMLYMAFPPIRDTLDGGRLGAANMTSRGTSRNSRGMGGTRGGYGMGGMGGMGGMNGMGMNGMGMGGGMGMAGTAQTPQPHGGGISSVGRWVSDEAIAACMESQGGGMQGQSGLGGMPVKSMIFSYMKKRAMFLILFGVCVILFTSTVFTDLGIRIGTWILKIVLGFGI